MAIREDLVTSAVTFLQDPSVAGSPIENRIAFLQSKNLTQEEVDTALARAGGGQTSTSYPGYAPQQVARPAQPGYGGYQQFEWRHSPPEPPKRDWRDWFIMATVMGGVGYGIYFVAKRYVYPMIAPPTPPQLEADKQSIDESFEKAFALLDQLAKDTDSLKAAEQARTERLDAALAEVENVINDLKTASRRREDESRRVSDEVRGLKDLIPRAMEGQKENTDTRLKELNTELKSLKTLMGQRLNPPASTTTNSYNRPPNSDRGAQNLGSTLGNGTHSATSTENITPRPATVTDATGSESTAAAQTRTASPFNSGASVGRAAIPAWQMAASKRSESASANGSTNTSPENSA